MIITIRLKNLPFYLFSYQLIQHIYFEGESKVKKLKKKKKVTIRQLKQWHLVMHGILWLILGTTK